MSSLYSTIQGDTWDIISLKNYGSEKYVDILVEANYTHRFVFIFSAGVSLTIPVIEQQTENDRNLPPWRRSQ